MIALFKKEVRALFNSLIAYLVIIVFLGFHSLVLWILPGNYNLLEYGYANLDHFFFIAPYVFLLLIPALSMRSLAEEQRAGTLSFLLCKPISDFKIILAKYFAILVLLVFSLIPTFIYVFSIYQLGLPKGNLDLGAIGGSYLGLLFIGACFASVGVFTSSLSSNQIIAFILGVIICASLFIGFDFTSNDFIQNFGLNAHYSSISRGVLAPKDLIYFIGFIALFLVFAKQCLTSLGRKDTLKIKNVKSILLVLIAVVLLNILGDQWKSRIDLTAEKRYQLSAPTKTLLSELDDDVYVKIYLGGDLPAGFRRLQLQTRELLEEFKLESNFIHYRFINPSSLSENQGRNQLYNELISQGLNPTNLQVKTAEGMQQKIIFPGALISSQDRTIAVELLKTQLDLPPEVVLNNSIQALEFNLANAIKNSMHKSRRNLAFIHGHGELSGDRMASAIEVLSSEYNVGTMQLDQLWESLVSENKFLKIDLIIIAKPQHSFSESDKFIIDQYLMQGGKIIWAIDPIHVSMDSLRQGGETMAFPYNLNLEDQWFTYGVRFNTNLVMDLNALPIPLRTGQVGGQAQIEFFPWYYYPLINATQTHPIVKNLNAIKTEFISELDTIAIPYIKKSILLKTSDYSQVVQTPVIVSFQILNKEVNQKLFSKSAISAVLLEGEFKSVFKNRSAPFESNYKSKTLSVETKMVFIADGDVFSNQIHNSQDYPLPLGYDQFTNQTFGNKDLLLNIASYLTDEADLISLRSREQKLRLLNKAKLSANANYWKMLNTILPILLIVLWASIQLLLRKRKYSRL